MQNAVKCGGYSLISLQARYRSFQPSRSLTTVSRYSCHGDFVPDGALDDRAHQSGGDVGGAQASIAEVGGQRLAVVDDRNGLSVESVPLGVLSRVLPSTVRLGAQFAEDGDDAADFLQSGRFGGQLPGRVPASSAGADDFDFFFQRGGQRQDNRVESPPQGGGEFVHAFIAVVGCGDDVEAFDGLYFAFQFGDGQSLFREDGDEVSCTSAGMRVSSSTRASLPARMARRMGLGTSARSLGPSASSRA